MSPSSCPRAGRLGLRNPSPGTPSPPWEGPQCLCTPLVTPRVSAWGGSRAAKVHTCSSLLASLHVSGRRERAAPSSWPTHPPQPQFSSLILCFKRTQQMPYFPNWVSNHAHVRNTNCSLPHSSVSVSNWHAPFHFRGMTTLLPKLRVQPTIAMSLRMLFKTLHVFPLRHRLVHSQQKSCGGELGPAFCPSKQLPTAPASRAIAWRVTEYPKSPHALILCDKLLNQAVVVFDFSFL